MEGPSNASPLFDCAHYFVACESVGSVMHPHAIWVTLERPRKARREVVETLSELGADEAVGGPEGYVQVGSFFCTQRHTWDVL